jgi:hypothetical protein
MALIVEDGQARANAESYCTVDFADAWHLSRGMSLWATMLNAEKEAAIRRAAQYMLQAYRLRWLGQRRTTTQALDWPRWSVPRVDVSLAYGGGAAYYDDEIVPVEIQQANAELAFKAAQGDLAPDVQRLTKREKVDVIEVEYAEGASSVVRYRSVDNLLAPFLKDAGGSSMAVSRS